jgi:hypothetical protein
MMGNEITIGAYSVPVLLTVLLGIIYKVVSVIPDKWKALISISAGILIGIAAMFYNEPVMTAKVIIDYILLGLMAGAASIGLYEGVWKTATDPRD